MKTDLITYEELTRLLHYNPETGIFTWKVDRIRVKPGDVAGYLDRSNNAVFIRINDIRYKASHLAWFYIHEEFPTARLYFNDRDPTNIRISNLRMGKSPNKGKPIKVICPDCGHIRKIQRSGTKKSLLVGELPEIPCNLCSRKRKRKESKIPIVSGNCLIKSSRNRCHKPGIEFCRYYNQCLDIAAKRSWPGWTGVEIDDLSAKT